MNETVAKHSLLIQAWEKLVDEGKIIFSPNPPKFQVGSLVRLLGWSKRPWLVKNITCPLGAYVYEIQAVRAMRINVIEVEERRIVAHHSNQPKLMVVA
jgi:hypothetical protein